MADGKKITIHIETVQGNTSGTKKTLAELEREVIASQKRVEASRKSTARTIHASVQAETNAEIKEAKRKANEFIGELRRVETERKRLEVGAQKSATSIRGYLNSAFGGGLIGGFAGGLFGSVMAQMAQLPSFFKMQLDEMVSIAAARQNAFKGLESIAGFKGIQKADAQAVVNNLRLVKGGIVDVAEASTALKNLLATGFSLPQATKLLERFSDSAAFGKQSALGFGEAIRTATEGLKNGNSILVDNAGVTKNLSVILQEHGKAKTDVMNITSDASVREAVYAGLIKETAGQVGDADKLMLGWTGTTAALAKAKENLYASIGDIITQNPHLRASIIAITGDINSLTDEITNTETQWNKSVNSRCC